MIRNVLTRRRLPLDRVAGAELLGGAAAGGWGYVGTRESSGAVARVTALRRSAADGPPPAGAGNRRLAHTRPPRYGGGAKSTRKEEMHAVSTQGEQLAGQFMRHRSVTVDEAGRLPADKLDFKPWPGAMSLGELLWHVAGSHHMFVQIALGNEPQGQRPERPADLEGIRSALGRLAETDAAALRSLTDEQLATPRAGFGGQTLPARAWLDIAREHEVHHKGELFVYGRMLGVEPPFFISRG